MAFPGRWRAWMGFAPPQRLQWALQGAKNRRARLTSTINYLEGLVGDAPEVSGTTGWTPSGRRIHHLRAAIRRLKFQRAMVSTFISEFEEVARTAPAARTGQPAASPGPRSVADYDL